MNFISIMAMAAPAAAEGAEAPKQNPLIGLLPFIIIIGAMFFLTIRSQKKQQARRAEMLSKLVKGTKVILANGIIGTISAVEDKKYSVEIAANVQVQVIPSGIVEIVPDAVPEAK